MLPAIGLVLGLVSGLGSLALAFALCDEVDAAGFGGVYALELLLSLGLLVFMAYAAVQFFGKKRKAPATMIALMIAAVLSSGLLLAIEWLAGAEAFAVESAEQLLRTPSATAFGFPTSK